jgi:hypothetical protein
MKNWRRLSTTCSINGHITFRNVTASHHIALVFRLLNLHEFPFNAQREVQDDIKFLLNLTPQKMQVNSSDNSVSLKNFIYVFWIEQQHSYE